MSQKFNGFGKISKLKTLSIFLFCALSLSAIHETANALTSTGTNARVVSRTARQNNQAAKRATRELNTAFQNQYEREQLESDMTAASLDVAAPNYDSLSSELKAETRQFNKDMKSAAKDSSTGLGDITDAANRDKFEYEMENEIANQIDKDIEQQTELSDKELQKQIECESKDPPKTAKKNKLGLWVCVETDETIAAREEKKKTNKNRTNKIVGTSSS